jgi:CRP/FNR family transcriptional regulator
MSAVAIRSLVATPQPCAACAMRRMCIPSLSTAASIGEFAACVERHRRVPAGAHIHRAGERAGVVYAVRSGFVKTTMTTDDGREQVIAFAMMGDFVGVEGAASGEHASDAVALEDTTLCEVPIGSAFDASVAPGVASVMRSAMAAEIRRQRSMMLLLGTLHAEERLAWFLVDLGQRYQARGFSASRFVLRMSRADLGSYLGLRLETVSRLLSRLHKEGILRVSNKTVEILDLDAVRTLTGQGFEAPKKPVIDTISRARDGLHY